MHPNISTPITIANFLVVISKKINEIENRVFIYVYLIKCTVATLGYAGRHYHNESPFSIYLRLLGADLVKRNLGNVGRRLA